MLKPFDCELKKGYGFALVMKYGKWEGFFSSSVDITSIYVLEGRYPLIQRHANFNYQNKLQMHLGSTQPFQEYREHRTYTIQCIFLTEVIHLKKRTSDVKVVYFLAFTYEMCM